MANNQKILIVLTNWDKLGDTGNKTGWYLPEVAHPHHVFTKAGFIVEFASPKGGKAPLDPGSADMFGGDEICKQLLANKSVMAEIDNTKAVDKVKASDYKALFFAGGHGPMYDLPNNPTVAKLVADVYEEGRIVSAVCHGTVGFVDVKLKNGQYLVKGQKVTSFTNAEEDAVKLSDAMPFLLETKLKEQGAQFEAKGNFECNVVISGRIITGQNPASGADTAKAIIEAIKNPQLNAL